MAEPSAPNLKADLVIEIDTLNDSCLRARRLLRRHFKDPGFSADESLAITRLNRHAEHMLETINKTLEASREPE